MNFVEKKKKIDRIYARINTEMHDALSNEMWSFIQIIKVVFSYLVSVVKIITDKTIRSKIQFHS